MCTMRSQPTALVIGAGLGGIATAARLAQSGYDVTVLEKNDVPGGRCGQLVRDGPEGRYRFDTGATLFLMREVFAQTYAALGERMEDHLDLRRIDPTYGVHFEDGTQLALTADLNTMHGQLEAIEPDSFRGLLRYVEEGYRHYHLVLDSFVSRNFCRARDYFNPMNLKLIFGLKPLVRHYANIGHYFHDPHLKAAFTFQNMYLGLSPFDAPATYSLLQYTELVGGVWFPMGGIYRVIESLVQIAEAHGVRFVYDTPVTKIEVEGERATAVRLEDGSSMRADVIVANADLPYIYSSLLPESNEAHRLKRMRYTCSAIMFYWGVGRTYPQLDTHNVYLASDYKGSFERIFRDHTLPSEPSFYVHVPSRIDPSAAPPGKDALFVLVPVGHINTPEQDWATLQSQARSAVLRRLTPTVASDLQEQIEFEAAYTPHDWLTLYNLARGSAFGLSHNFMQVGYLRPHNRHDRYRNLYFVGSSTHPGTGLPMVLMSAKLTTERVLREQRVVSPRYMRGASYDKRSNKAA
ncbi:MAG TPA: phytoene desaturase family protein [Chloroflexia bacterium]|nr:phytoene desaturase family protein [Chloroflexia bacterium]